jgi:hypothetical protein
MENKRYHVVPSLEGVHAASSFVDRIYTEVPADKPDHPSCYEGEWICEHTLCPVRGVRLRVKAFHHQHLPQLRCPLCLRTLVFRHWLNVIALQEVPAPPAKKRCLAPSTKRDDRPRKRKSSPGTDAANPA